jgi:hypothetical protein
MQAPEVFHKWEQAKEEEDKLRKQLNNPYFQYMYSLANENKLRKHTNTPKGTSHMYIYSNPFY